MSRAGSLGAHTATPGPRKGEASAVLHGLLTQGQGPGQEVSGGHWPPPPQLPAALGSRAVGALKLGLG